MAFLPKCPLCALPLLAAAGIALPQGPVVEGLVAGAIATWFALVLATARWMPVRLAAAGAASAILGGRLLSLPWLSLAGGALMLAVAFWILFRPRPCDAACRTSQRLSPLG